MDRTERLASLLRKRGVGTGDRVAIILPNGLDFPVAWLALPLLGAIAVPINVRYRQTDLAHVLEHSGATHAIVGPEQHELMREVAADLAALRDTVVISADRFERALQTAPHFDSSYTAAGRDATTIQYTSGSTGLPKGCVLDHLYWLRLARTFQDHLALGEGDVALTAQPQSYMDPSWNLVLTLLAGVPLVILPRFSASTFWQDVVKNDVTFFYCIGTMPLYLVEQPASDADRQHKVRMVYCSGIPSARHIEFEERWGCTWRETYGSTELGVVLLARPDDTASVGSGGMGTPVPGREIRVVDEDGTDVAHGTVGELLVRGPDVMQGYHRDPEADRAWRPNGWARTGDLVIQLDRGGLRLVGRTKDMIRRAGENISAAEVEGVLVEHPSVQAAACIAVPDPLRGEEVKAYVQPGPGVTALAPSELHAFVRSRLAGFKVPRYIEVVDSLPLTQSEKVAKPALVASRDDHRMGAWDAQTDPPNA